MGHPFPHRGRWPTQDLPLKCLSPRIYFFSFLTGSPTVGTQTQELRRWNLKLAPVHKGKERPKEEENHSRRLGGNFNKQWNLHTKFVRGTHRSADPCTPTRTLKVYTETLTGFNPYRWSQLHITLSRLHPWKWLPLWEWWECTLPGQRGVRSLQLPEFFWRVKQW